MKAFQWPEHSRQEVSNDFATFCLNGNIEKVKQYIQKGYIEDLTYENGLFCIYAARNGHDEILKLLYSNCPEIQKFNHYILIAAASYGKIKCIEFLLETGSADPSELKGTSAYNNYIEVETLFNKYLAVQNGKKLMGNNESEKISDFY